MLTFYATVDSDSIRSYIPPVPVMLPASSWARKGMKPPRLPDHISEKAADCGGFVATKLWGDYRYTPDQYVEWLSSWNPQWVATMDYCCEDEITTGQSGLVRYRQQRTTDMAWHFWQHYRDVPWAWVPTVQGWNVDDYRLHARDLKPLLEEMQRYYGPDSAWRVGIGTLCRRASSRIIFSIIHTVAAELPGIPLHLWGVKLSVIQSSIALPESVVSIDSAAWNGFFGRYIEKWRGSGLSRREYAYLVTLPEYVEKISHVLSSPKQLSLF